MPRLSRERLPKYRLHKASGHALVTLDGRDFYLGPHGSKTSRARYDDLVAEWLANDRRLNPTGRAAGNIPLVTLMSQFWAFVKQNYRLNGRPTSEYYGYKSALRFVKKHCQSLRVDEFGPLTLKTVREQMVASGLARVGVNAYVSKIKRMFAWGVENELVPVEIYQALRCVPGLRQGKTDAPETEPILPVADTTVEATLPHLSTIVADMVRFERFTGCRPAEVCIIRPGDVDDTNSVWVYRPFTHKTAHRGRGRTIFIGPRAQAILTPYLARPSDQFCFSPAESERARLAELHSMRQTPLRFGNRPGTNRRERPERKPGLRYTTDSYRRAIQRACDEAFPPPPGMNDSAAETWRAEHRWSPNQLRHSAATEIRQAFGLEAAQVTLGHARADVTQIYAERDNRLAAKIMGEVG